MIFLSHTGGVYSPGLQDTDRDYYMTPEEAKKYGVIDEVIKTCYRFIVDPTRDGTNWLIDGRH